MNDTPRTDANAGWFVSSYGIIRSDGLFTDHKGPLVHANFARQLERENAELRHYRDKYWKLMECEERQMIANKRKEAKP